MNAPHYPSKNGSRDLRPTAGSRSPDLRQRIATLNADIQAAEAKASRLQASIHVRRQTLNRLRFQLTLRGEDDAVRTKHE